jgi:transcriptional regulator with XRE-family HTH domain
MKDPYKKIRAQIAAARHLMDLDQMELASLLGMSHTKISNVETGRTKSASALLEVKTGMEREGVTFTANGVEYTRSHVEVLSGKGCYLELLSFVERILCAREDKTLLIMYASDAASPPEVNEQYRRMRAKGIEMRQLISEGDTLIMGGLEEYRQIPKKYFSNIVRLIYGNCVAQVSGDETKVTIHYDEAFARSERLSFEFYWDNGLVPKKTTARERF